MTTFKPTIARYWCVTDLECTGLDPQRHEIIQIARVVIDTVDHHIVTSLTMSQYIQPTRWDQRDDEAMEVNGLTLSKLQAEGISPDLALEYFCQDVNWDETVLAAWGVDFETKFLREAFRQVGRDVPFHYKVIDVRSLGHLPRARMGFSEYMGLGESCDFYSVHFDRGMAHDALYDATKTAELALELLRSRP
ncbi:MAG: 3'-5' exonuclease [Chloroflexi bacterium]|nr:3'-5' exonuclease [Chloroflexota bacterium]